MFGIAKCREALNGFTQALDIINRILVLNPNYLCAVIEKMKLLLSNQEWDQCLEVAQRALTIDDTCLEALRYQILELLCREGRYTEVNRISKLRLNEIYMIFINDFLINRLLMV